MGVDEMRCDRWCSDYLLTLVDSHGSQTDGSDPDTHALYNMYDDTTRVQPLLNEQNTSRTDKRTYRLRI